MPVSFAIEMIKTYQAISNSPFPITLVSTKTVGLGKTVMLMSLILKSKKAEEDGPKKSEGGQFER
jgi:hypothetical protein